MIGQGPFLLDASLPLVLGGAVDGAVDGEDVAGGDENLPPLPLVTLLDLLTPTPLDTPLLEVVVEGPVTVVDIITGGGDCIETSLDTTIASLPTEKIRLFWGISYECARILRMRKNYVRMPSTLVPPGKILWNAHR